MDATMTQIEKLGSVSFGSWWCGAGNDPRTSPLQRGGAHDAQGLLLRRVGKDCGSEDSPTVSDGTVDRNLRTNTTERAFALDTCIICLFLSKDGEDSSEYRKVQYRHCFNEVDVGCVSAAPTIMNTLLVKFHTVFLPELSEGPLVWDDFPANSSGVPGG